ncbi:Uncharacterised protein [Serratia fonticola]|uniref:Uncharacterized protein n=1 Tax=Serratia fonticola TaxID=47917 RepID=A0A4U9TLG5_SERFO|nr:Uncharacterised protein [Serratia fonticola]
MIINNVKLVLEHQIVAGSLEMTDGVIRSLPIPQASYRRRWMAKAAGCCPG